MRIGAKVPNSGPLPERLGIGEMGASLEAAGFESLWRHHIVLPAQIDSRYPFAEDGRATWATDTPYFDALIALALIAQATERATIGTAVLVLPLRQPVVFAKQAASIDVASGDASLLGVGAGWLEEEFNAINVPFAARGRRLDDLDHARVLDWHSRRLALRVLRPARRRDRAAAPGPPGAAADRRPLGGRATPSRLDGMGRLAQQALPQTRPRGARWLIATMRDAAVDAGRDPAALRVVLRIVESMGQETALAPRLAELEAVGVDEIIVDVYPEDGRAAEVFETLRGATG